MTRLATLLALFPATALAHGGPAGHAHPHGIEGLALAIGAVVLGWLIWRIAR